jgi:hypothetical protein
LTRGTHVGVVEKVDDTEIREVNPSFLNAVHVKEEALGNEKDTFIRELLVKCIPKEWVPRYYEVIKRNHQAVSRHTFDLGRTQTLMHKITLKTDEPVYVKQFKIPEAHRVEVEKHVHEWLKLGVIQPYRSKFNSPLFVVPKKNGGLRLVQDFRALNAQTHVDKYSMLDVTECIAEVGKSGSGLFTTIDLTAGFWQMLLHPKSRPYTAFTVPGRGQFQWITSPMGLLGCPASFQQLMETVVKGIPNVLVYIDNLLIHSETHEEHLQILDSLLQQLIQHGIKINLEKCIFASKEVNYLGFRLTEEGIKPGPDKLKVVKEAKPPESVCEVRQFLGLCNFFRSHVRNFAQVSAPLTALTKKECQWKKGTMPSEALQLFRELQSHLCSEPVVAYPRRDRLYALITNAALGDEVRPGGLGAILTQMTPTGEHHVIAYASRKMQKHEKNYTPFLLEMQAALWGMDHFCTYLKGRHFTLFTDHKPLEKLEKRHTRTLNRLQEAMNIFDLEVVYKKGSEMHADFLSRNVTVLSWDSQKLIEEQEQDPLIKAMKEFLLHKELPSDEKCRMLIKHFSDECFLENDLVWRRIKRKGETDQVVIMLPQTQISHVLKEAHGHLLSGHDGLLKTKERISQCYYWPGMDKDIQDHLQSCHKCQIRKVNDTPSPTLLTPLPQPTEPNQRIHADLFGPLKISGNNKKYILCMTDAFTKYVELVAVENKEASTVGSAIFERWICRYGSPLEIITDQGKEFCNQLSDDLYRHLQVTHSHMSPHHPACNSQAEVANKTIAKYLSSVVSDNTLNWELYIAPLMLSYNTSFHRSIKNTPHYLTYGLEARLPSFMTTDLRRKFYGENSSDEIVQRLLYARDVARRHNEEASDQYRQQYDQKAEPHSYQLQQLVLLDEHSFLHKNAKLAPKWSGPHRIIRLKGESNVELQLRTGRKLIVHVNRLKPYTVPLGEDPKRNTRIFPKPSDKVIDLKETNSPDLTDQFREDIVTLPRRHLPEDKTINEQDNLRASIVVFPPTDNGAETVPIVTEPVRKRGRPAKRVTATIPPPPRPPAKHRYPLRRLQPTLEFPQGLGDRKEMTQDNSNVVDDNNRPNDNVQLNPVLTKQFKRVKKIQNRQIDPWHFPYRHYITAENILDAHNPPQPLALSGQPSPASSDISDSETEEDEVIDQEPWWDPADVPLPNQEDSEAEIPESEHSSPAPSILSDSSAAPSETEEDSTDLPKPARILPKIPPTPPVASQSASTGTFAVPAAPHPSRSRSRTTGLDPRVKVGLRSKSRSVSREIHGAKVFSEIPEVEVPSTSRSAKSSRPPPRASSQTQSAPPSFSDVAAAALFGHRGQTAVSHQPAVFNRSSRPDARATRGRNVPVATASTTSASAASTTSASAASTTSASTTTSTTASRPQTRSQGPAQEPGLQNPKRIRGGKR